MFLLQNYEEEKNKVKNLGTKLEKIREEGCQYSRSAATSTH